MISIVMSLFLYNIGHISKYLIFNPKINRIYFAVNNV